MSFFALMVNVFCNLLIWLVKFAISSRGQLRLPARSSGKL